MKPYLLKNFHAMFGLSRPTSGLFDFDSTDPYYHNLSFDLKFRIAAAKKLSPPSSQHDGEFDHGQPWLGRPQHPLSN
jgi:hypothetical protein